MRVITMLREMIRRWNWALWMGLASLVIGCGGGNEGPTPKVESVAGIRTGKIQIQTVPDEIAVPGSVIAASTAQVAARAMGTVVQVAAREGDTVKRGQLLAQLDERELGARRNSAQAREQASNAGVEQAARAVAAAEAQGDVAKKTYERYLYLKEQKSVSPQEFDEVAAKYQAAQAGLEQAKAGLRQAQAGALQAKSELQAASSVAGYARIVAPFDGRVVRRQVEPGSLISPGMLLFVVEDTGHYQLEVTLPADALVAVHKGTIARVELDGQSQRTIPGKVAEIEGGADPAAHTAKARIDLAKDPDVQSGMFGRAFFVNGEKRALIVPTDALVERGQLRGIYLVRSDGVAHLRLVTLGKSRGTRVEVLSGLNDGETLVLNPGAQELDGKKVYGFASEGGERHP